MRKSDLARTTDAVVSTLSTVAYNEHARWQMHINARRFARATDAKNDHIRKNIVICLLGLARAIDKDPSLILRYIK